MVRGSKKKALGSKKKGTRVKKKGGGVKKKGCRVKKKGSRVKKNKEGRVKKKGEWGQKKKGRVKKKGDQISGTLFFDPGSKETDLGSKKKVGSKKKKVGSKKRPAQKILKRRVRKEMSRFEASTNAFSRQHLVARYAAKSKPLRNQFIKQKRQWVKPRYRMQTPETLKIDTKGIKNIQKNTILLSPSAFDPQPYPEQLFGNSKSLSSTAANSMICERCFHSICSSGAHS